MVSQREKKFNAPHYLSVCAIMKNEGPYLKEWIEFHRIVGVEKFYLYDNESTDSSREILEPYVKSGIVDYTYFPGQKMQRTAYQDCVSKHKYDSKWIAFIDLDEFIVPTDTKTVPEFLKSIPANVGQLVVGWKIYGSSRHKTKPDGLVTENYTMRSKTSWLWKMIINPRFIARFGNPHFAYMVKLDTVEEDLTPVKFPIPKEYWLQNIKADKIRINHYHCKSFEEYSKRSKRGDADFGSQFAMQKYTEQTFKNHDRNEVSDPIPDKYLQELKKNMQN
jgi:hypothetical protein